MTRLHLLSSLALLPFFIGACGDGGATPDQTTSSGTGAGDTGGGSAGGGDAGGGNVGGGGVGGSVGGGAPSLDPVAVYVATNGDQNQGDVTFADQVLTAALVYDSGANEGMVIDGLGRLYHASDGDAGVGIRTSQSLASRGGDDYSLGLDRALSGNGTTLQNPKGMALAAEAGLLLVADVGASQIAVFGTAAGGNAPPVVTVSLAVAVWDLAYDPAADRLFAAAVDGTVLVFDTFVGGDFDDVPDRTITPAEGGDKISVNSHGIAYDAANDRLIVSDVGAATAEQGASFASDGQIFVIAGAAAASGLTDVAQRIQGTDLGNPVDLDFDGRHLRVAEKANDLVLVYANLYDRGSGDLEPDYRLAIARPESVATGPVNGATYQPDVSDLPANATIASVLATSNPQVGTGDLHGLSAGLSAEDNSFAPNVALESATIRQDGDVVATYDGGIAFIGRASQRDGGSFDASRDRTITGAATGLNAPKGLDVVEARGIVLVADNGNSTVRAFSLEASGNVAPSFVTNLPAAPWDLDYDPAGDRLYVALVDGTVAVFDAYLATDPDVATPARIIIPSTAANAKLSVNLHGIVHDAINDVLLLSDVGQALFSTDGQLFAINAASTADGSTAVAVHITSGLGSSSQLGNPVDIAFDGTHLYVAEKSNDLVMRFDNILTSPGGDVAPSASFSLASVESVALVPASN